MSIFNIKPSGNKWYYLFWVIWDVMWIIYDLLFAIKHAINHNFICMSIMTFCLFAMIWLLAIHITWYKNYHENKK